MKRGEPKCHFGSPLKTIRYHSTGSLSFNRICNPVVCLYEGDSKVPFGHPQTSFFETIDEQSAIVLAQIAEVRIRKNF